MAEDCDVAIVGAGFTGLAAGLALAREGKKVCILEGENAPGGLAGLFEFRDGIAIDKFYHHFFLSDSHVIEFAKSLGVGESLVRFPSLTGMYYNRSIWRLTTPMDLLRFSPLPLFDRIRLGVVVLGVRLLKDWKSIEGLTVREWLEPLCGKRAFDLVWAPLIDSKFSSYADKVNAVWFWKKLVLRGSTRGKGGKEELMYFRGGFGVLAAAAAKEIERLGGSVRLSTRVLRASAKDEVVECLSTDAGEIRAARYLFTPSFPIVANLFEGIAPEEWMRRIRRVKYLGNICLVLCLDRPLSDTYWINVNDPGFPFVGVIEHTNLDRADAYKGRHIVFLSRYIDTSAPEWSYSDGDYLEYALPYLQKMFPQLEREWILDHAIWRAESAQPVTERGYSDYVPGFDTPFPNAKIATMAQIYPEDRGVNYAIREGKAAAARIFS